MRFDSEVFKHVMTGSPALRYHICAREPLYFAAYYFPEYFKFKIPDFHFDFYQDCKDLASGEIDEAMWCSFRDGAKTSVGKIAFATWIICYKKKSFLGWDSQDGDNAGAALFDITIALQTNRRLIADFGHLYYKKKSSTTLSEAKMKRINSFITEHGVKVVTFSTQQPIRGQVQGAERMDCVIFDDFENEETKDSPPKTNKIISHIDTYRSGMPAGACALYLCNYLTDSGSVAQVMEDLNRSQRARVRFVPGVSNGVIAWPDKFVKTEAEALKLNHGITDPKLRKISLEAKLAKLGRALYETEFMLNPAHSGDLFFDRDKVMAALKKAIDPIEEVAGFKMWAKFNPTHMYSMGADTAEGIGGDANASVIIDLKQAPNLLVASFADNNMAPDVFGTDLKRQGAFYSYPYLVPEINNTGYATVSSLINMEYPNLYQREVKNHTTNQVKKEYGWRATIGTKWEILGEFKTAFESGGLEILDAGLLSEMKFFTKAAARLISRETGATRHYDKLRAAALAWHGRKYALPPAATQKRKYEVPGQDKPYQV